MNLVANVIMGDRPEPFLKFCMESISEAVDLVVLNDNSDNPDNPNIPVLKKTSLYKNGKVDVLQSNFKEIGGFAAARNICLDRVSELIKKKEIPGENLWILYLDCDEVHPLQLTGYVKDFISHVPGEIGIIDGYMYQFILTFDYYTTLERRHNLFFRFHRDIRWERPVHETLAGLKGKRIATGYTYCHYGYLLSREDLLKRWQVYDKYNGLDFNLKDVDESNMLMEKSALAIPYTKGHPAIMKEYIDEFRRNPGQLNLKFQDKIMKLREDPIFKIKNYLRHLNYELRLRFRDMEKRKFRR